MPRDFHASLMKPLAALATPGAYLYGKYHQYRRQQQEQSRRKVTEKELAQLNHKIDKLLAKLDEHEPEMATTQDDECVVCISAKASMQTYPCGHQVVCRKCFVKTIQMAVSQRLLPLRCVICRTKILRLKQQSTGTGSSRSFILSHSHSHLSQLTSYSTTSSYSSAASSVDTSTSGVTSGVSLRPHHHHLRHRTDSSQRPLLINDVRSEHRFRLIVSPPPPDQVTTSGVQSSDSWSSLAPPSKSSSANRVGDSSASTPEIMCFDKPAPAAAPDEKSVNRKFHMLPSLPKVTLRSRSSLAKAKKE